MSDSNPEAETGSPSAMDRAAIEAVARDYVEGYFDGDEARMRRCLHPDLVKRSVRTDPTTGTWGLGRTATADDMIGWAREGRGRDAAGGGRPIAITIENVFRHIASVKVVSRPFMDLLHVGKVGERWCIVNVLWEAADGETPPTAR